MRYLILLLLLAACAPKGTDSTPQLPQAVPAITTPTPAPIVVEPTPMPADDILATPAPSPSPTPIATPAPAKLPLSCIASGVGTTHAIAICDNGNLAVNQSVQWTANNPNYANVAVVNVLNSSTQVCVIYNATLGATQENGRLECGNAINGVTGALETLP